MQKKFNFTSGLLDNCQDLLITVPMVKDFPIETKKAYAILCFNGLIKDASLKALSCTGDDIKVNEYKSKI